MNKPKQSDKEPSGAVPMDDVLKRMLSSPPDPKRAKPVKKDDKKKPAG